MPFTEADISGLVLDRRGAELLVRWASAAPEGTVYQVYLGRRLAWSGTQRFAVLPRPTERTPVVVGRVEPGEADRDRSGDPGFPVLPEDRATLSWTGGTFLGEGVRSFAIYGEDEPGGGITGTPRAIVPASMSDPLDGAGLGPAGKGGAGRAAGVYSWTSPPLSAGTWAWEVRARDASGVESAPVAASTPIVAPPRPPAPWPEQARLRVASVSGGDVSLQWQPSPDHVDP